MAVVPTYSQQIAPRPINQATASDRASPYDFGSSIGAGLSALGSGLNGVGDAMDTLGKFEAHADATKAYNSYLDQRRQILYDPNTGYMTATGDNALGTARQKAIDALKKARDSISAGLSPTAAKLFNTEADSVDQQGQQQMIQHAGTQLRDYVLQQQNAKLQNTLNEAGFNWSDAAASNKYLTTAENTVRETAKLQGWSADVTAEKLMQARTAAFSQRAQNMALSGNPLGAQQLIDSHKADMTPSEYVRISSALKPAVQLQQATQAVDAATASTSGVDRLGLPAWLGRNESGGDPNAKNPRSSAAGYGQMIDSTYLATVHNMAKAGKADWAAGMTDEQILATRTGADNQDKWSSVIKAHLAENRYILKENGYSRRPSNEYLMWRFGSGGALALLKMSKDQPNMDASVLLGQKVIDANPDLAGMTVAQVIAHVARQAGDPNGTPTGGDVTTPMAVTSAVPNPTAALNKLYGISDPTVQQKAVQLLLTRLSANDRVQAAERENLMNDAYKNILQGKKPSDLPIDVQGKIGYQGMSALDGAYRAHVTGEDINNPTVFQRLLDLSLSTKPTDRKAFENMNLNDYADQLSQSSLTSLKGEQAKLRAAVGASAGETSADMVYKPDDFAKATSRARDQFVAVTGFAPGSAASQEQNATWSHFALALKQRMEDYANANGVAMPQSMIDKNVAALLMPVHISGGLFGIGSQNTILANAPYRGKGTTVDPAMTPEQVPYAARNRITESLGHAWGRAPTEQEVVDQYEREVLYSAGLRPEMAYRDIPKDIRRQLEDKYPKASEQQRIDYYLRMMIEATK